MIDWFKVGIFIIYFAAGGLFGFSCGYLFCDNQYEKARKLREQQRAWNEYIELLKGVQNGK